MVHQDWNERVCNLKHDASRSRDLIGFSNGRHRAGGGQVWGQNGRRQDVWQVHEGSYLVW